MSDGFPPRAFSAVLVNGLAVLLMLGAVLPFLVVPYFPAVDLWTHLAVSEVHHQVLTGTGPLADSYRIEWSPYPYWAGHVVLGVLRRILPVLQSGHAALALSHVMLVAGAWALAHAVGLPRHLRLLAFAACFSMPVWYGFVTYALALGPSLATLAVLLWAMRALTPSRWLAGASALVVLFLLHVEAWGPCGVLAGTAALAHPDRRARLARLLMCSAPSLLLAAVWARSHATSGEDPVILSYGPPKDRLGLWQYHHLLDAGVTGMVPALVVCGAVVAVALWLARGRPRDTLDEPWRNTLGLAAGAALLHLALPKSIDGGGMPAWGFFLRTGALTTVTAMLCWARLPARLQAPAVAAVLLTTVGMDVQAWQFARAFSAEVAPLDARLAQTPPGTTGLVVSAAHADEFGTGQVHFLEHLGGLWLVRGAVTTQFFRSTCTLLGLTHEGRPRDHLGVLLHQPVTTWTEHVQQVLQQGADAALASDLEAAGYQRAWSHGRWTLWELRSGVGTNSDSPAPPR
ncbi:MAG: hypothetical protein HY904_20690 [Deltaproteobacteria bacterium]|nr:hypothetical protein [Deltaproteobacteria bacterium]